MYCCLYVLKEIVDKYSRLNCGTFMCSLDASITLDIERCHRLGRMAMVHTSPGPSHCDSQASGSKVREHGMSLRKKHIEQEKRVMQKEVAT